MKKQLLALLLTLTLTLSACGGPASGSATPAQPSATPPKTSLSETAGKTKVIFWHAVGGRNGEALDALVTAYNQSQNLVEVEAQYQGTYDDAIAKIRTTPAGEGPDIMQLYDIGTRWMIDSKLSLKMQDFIDADIYDMSDYEENILAYYTIDGDLYSMPFNCSSPVVVYNKEALERAGLDPETAFSDMKTCLQTAETLAAKGGVSVGGSFTDYSWVFEQLVSMQDKELLNNGNGRIQAATAMAIGENGAGLAILEHWKQLSASPSMTTFGMGTSESKQQFATGTVGFILDSCSTYVDLTAAASGNFTVGFAPLPKVNPEDQGGTSVGGGSLWIMDNQDENRAAAAWDFIKFATGSEQQARWAIGTGYLPIRTSAVELDFYKEYLKNDNPEIMVAIDSLRNSNPRNAGGLMGVFPQARVIIENEILLMVDTPDQTPQATLDAIVSQVNAEIELYNRTNS